MKLLAITSFSLLALVAATTALGAEQPLLKATPVALAGLHQTPWSPGRADASASADPVRGGPDYAVVPGALPLRGTRTIPTWHDVFTDPTNGLTYGVDLVGRQDPRTADVGTTTIPVAIIPVDLSFQASGGQTFRGSDSVQAVLNSPIFQPADYSAFSNNVGVQYEDAVMRSQFNQVGDSPFHLKLAPTVFPTLRLSVP